LLVWLSLDTWLITFLSVAYLLLLFVVAYWGQTQAKKNWVKKPWLYSLSLGVSCTSWAFYGTVGQAATTGAWLAPIYIGSIFCLMLAWPMFLKTLRIIKQQNLTSIADFIACRYDRSPKIGAIVTLVALVGTIPYIALQLRAVSTSFDLLTGTYQSGISTAFVVTIVLIVFSILFGARQIVASKQNQGLVIAIAFSSLVKLFALTAVGIFATFFVFDGFNDLLNQAPTIDDQLSENSIYLTISQTLLGAITIFILPQQFHMMMIENHNEQELKAARWLFPLYFILINLFVLPIAIAGQLSFPGGSVNADTYVLTIPLFYQQAWLGIVVYIGGLAAATSMVIIASIVLSTMISTEILNPLILRFKLFNSTQTPKLSGLLLNLRRTSIAAILLLAFIFERLIDQQNHLAGIGLLSFVLLAQIAPAIVGALYWRKATTNAAFVGLLIGSVVWLYTLLLPIAFPHLTWLSTGPWGVIWLKPTSLLGVNVLDTISHGVFYSLLLNILSFVVISLLSQRSVGEKLQAELFINKKQSQFDRHLSINDLYSLLLRFIDKDAADGLTRYSNQLKLRPEEINQQLVEHTRIQLSGVLGSASTRMVMKAASVSQQVPLEDVVSIVDEASQLFEFNRELLQSGVENIEQGISVVDSDMRLVAWNQRYIELLNYPKDVVFAGIPIEKLLNYNINRGVICGAKRVDLIKRRIEHMRLGHSHHFQRIMPNGIVLEIRGQAMPGGGFVSTFSDITAHIEAEQALQKANETLERRVQERTQQLLSAKAEAEAANSSKTRFLAAASHDLMQPFNALTLFTSMLKKKVAGDELISLANHIDDSLNVVEALLSDLVEISRLDSSAQKLDIREFTINDLLVPLENEFTVLANQEDITFRYQKSTCLVKTDKQMLRRILQNFLSNAVHYCNHQTPSQKNTHQEVGGGETQRQSKILLGVRHYKESIRIEVWDNGPGIPSDKQQHIFSEFERLEQTREVPGLGLGLAISERIATLLGLSISLRSTVGKGTCFMIDVPRVHINAEKVKLAKLSKISLNEASNSDAFNISVLLIDNDALMLTAMSSLLIEWGCRVIAAKDKDAIDIQLAELAQPPQLIIADYHLDDADNGVDLVSRLMTQQQWQVPCVICSADPSELVRQHTSDAQYQFLRKPIKPLALKRLIRKLIT